MLTYIISAFYAKMLVILGIALPITDAIAAKDYENYDVRSSFVFKQSFLLLLSFPGVLFVSLHRQYRILAIHVFTADERKNIPRNLAFFVLQE